MSNVEIKKLKVFGQPWTSKEHGYYAHVDKKVFKHQDYFYLLYTQEDDTHILLRQIQDSSTCKRLSKEFDWIQKQYVNISDGFNDLKKLVETLTAEQQKEAEQQIIEEKRGKSVFTRLDFDKEVSV